jgi:hypothetical protein
MQKIDWSKYLVSASGTIPRTPSGVEKRGNYRAVEGMSNRDVVGYAIARFEAPGGIIDMTSETPLATLSGLIYADDDWEGLDQGWYAYGVKAHYTSGGYSPYAFSNIVGHLMEVKVTVNVTLSTGEEPSGVHVTLGGHDYPYQLYSGVTPASGTLEYDPVWKGNYTVMAYKSGFDTYQVDFNITSDKVIDIILGEKKYKPTNLYVDPLTLIATWSAPQVVALQTEGFENEDFPPAGWTVIQNDYDGGWERANGYSGSWYCPPGDGYFALCNDDGYISHNGRQDRLITPSMNLSNTEGFVLGFNYFFDAYYGGSAYLEYSLNGGSSWEVIEELAVVGGWTYAEYDLTEFSGPTASAIMFAFHYDDNGYWADGMAVDNVFVGLPGGVEANYIDFYLFLDDAFSGSTTETTYDYAPLDYDVTYTASVAAHYTSGLSAKDYYTFRSVYLLPPTDLTGTAPDDAAILLWEPPLTPEMTMLSAPVFTGELPEGEATSIMPDPTPEHGGGGEVLDLGSRGSKAYALDLLSDQLIKYDVGTYTYTTFGSAPYSLFGGDFSTADTVTFYAIDYNSNILYSINKGTGAVTPIGGSGSLFSGGVFTGMACDKATGVMYVVYTDISKSQIGTVDLATGTKTAIGSTTTVAPGVIEIAIDGTGQMYGWDIVTDASYTVDKATGVFTMLGPLGYNANYAQGGNWDPLTDQIYLAAYGTSGELRVLDRATGSTVVLTSLPSEYDIFAFPGVVGGGGGGGEIPENLLGYNIYREGEFVNYVAHPTTFYVDEGLEPGEWCYTVTAVYDLTPYGYPNERGESMEEGPACVTVDYCFALEFMETWDLGSFSDNQWNTGTDNWFVNGQLGNPAPVAEFTWDPIMADYESSLTSYPLCASGITEGKMWLDYDVKLESVNSTGEEMLNVQVWNWDSGQWATVTSYSNADGSFGWLSDHINITAQAMNKVFRIRFQAQGVNTLDILSWFVDNIHVYRTCDGITDLTVTTQDFNRNILNWEGPAGSNIAEWIRWDTGEFTNVVGPNAAFEFDVAARWDAVQLVSYEGAAVTQIAFIPHEAACIYSVRVWLGVGAANMVVDQEVASPLLDEWNYVTLATPVPVDITQDLWIGYHINTTTGLPAGADDGPRVEGYGNMINWGGWQTAYQLNSTFDFNWCIQGYVESMAGAMAPLPVLPATQQNNTVQMPLIAKTNVVPVNPVTATSGGNREMTGYNVYVSKDGGAYELLDFTPENTYTHGPGIANGSYCYKVTAVWVGETDNCESALSEEKCGDISVGINDPSAGAQFALYPNPAVNHVFIISTSGLKRVTVYNAVGQLVADQLVSDRQYELNTASYTVGVYMIRVETGNGIGTRVLTIQR